MSDLQSRARDALQGRYAIQDSIGEGGMAVVFLAEDVKHARKVAVKVLRPELTHAMGAERFLEEIRISANLAHPHIVPLYDSGGQDDLLYYVMPFIEGESLRDLLDRERQLALEDALRIASGVAAALAFAHSHGIVHRDIKPENILLAAGEPLVADFGIARAVSAAVGARLTATGFSVGTPVYMSPEQATNDGPVDARTDVYSLACVVYEMIGGTPPFTGPTATAIIARKLAGPVPKLSLLRDTVPPAVMQAIEKALAVTPADRFASAAQFAKALGGGGEASLTGSVAAPGPAASPQSLAVLPFVNSSRDPEDEYLSDGISEELIHALGKVEGLRVVARSSAFVFKGRNEDVRVVGQRLGVGTVLEGSVRRSGNRLRVTAQLVNVADGYQLWSERYDRTLDDMFTVQDDVTRATVEALKVTLLGPSSAASPLPPPRRAASAEAYELYLRGRHAWNRRTPEGLRQSTDYLQRALALDPGFALAHAALADAHVTLGIYGTVAPGEAMPQAEAAAKQALACDAGLAEAFTALACATAVYRWQWEHAEELFRRAIALKPGYSTARHWFAINCLAPEGRFAEAREELARARETDPLSPAIDVSLGLVAHFEGDMERATAEFTRALETDPAFGMAHYFLGEVRAQQGRHDDAVTAFRRARELTGDSAEVLAALAHSVARGGGGRRAEAAGLLGELTERAAGRYVSPVLVALVHLGLGDRDAVFESLDRAAEVRASHLIWLNVRPVFAELRPDPRFRALIERLGLAGA